MSDFPAHLCGAVIDPAITDAVCVSLTGQGKEPLFSDAAPQLAGFGDGKSMLHQDSEFVLYGKTLPSWSQSRGTCTEQGTGRAWQDATNWVLANEAQTGAPLQWASEVLYGVARVQIGKGQFGKASPWGTPSNRVQGDGCSGAFVAQAAHDFGWLPRGVYGPIDLSKPREDLAIQWGNVGTPSMLLPDCIKADACMRVMTIEDLRDGLAAGFGAACCGAFATHGTRDADGILEPVACGGHCQECCGVYVDRHGDLIFVWQQSWGDAGPQGGGPFKFQNGREVIPREGSCGVHVESVQKYLRAGEIWLLAAPRNLPCAKAQAV